MQNHQGPMRRVEARERSLDEVPVGQMARIVAVRRFVDREKGDLDGATPSPTSLVEAAVHEKTVQPGVEPLRITKPGQVSPSSHEGVLDRVARELRVPKDEARGSIE